LSFLSIWLLICKKPPERDSQVARLPYLVVKTKHP
jgi:hypothetical protein